MFYDRRRIRVVTFETRHRYAMRDDLEPRRRVDGGLALFFGLGHPSVIELAAHAALFAAAHGCERFRVRRRDASTGCAAVSGDGCGYSAGTSDEARATQQKVRDGSIRQKRLLDRRPGSYLPWPGRAKLVWKILVCVLR